jgi:hypothetical protein
MKVSRFTARDIHFIDFQVGTRTPMAFQRSSDWLVSTLEVLGTRLYLGRETSLVIYPLHIFN